MKLKTMSRSPFNTLGGVTPLKKGEKGSGSGKSKSIKQHAGDVGKKATATSAQDRSGYQRSGSDFINVHSFTANTRLSPSLANTLGPSLSSAVGGKTKQTTKKTDGTQIGTDANGNPIFLPDGFSLDTKLVSGAIEARPGYEQRWEDISDPSHDKNSTYQKYVDAHPGDETAAYEAWKSDSEEWNRNNPQTAGPDKYVTTIKDNKGTVIHTYENEGEYDATNSLNIEEE